MDKGALELNIVKAGESAGGQAILVATGLANGIALVLA